MIDGYQKFRVPDHSGKNHIIAEVNWDENDPEVSKCRVVKFNFPDGSKSIVKRDDLNQILFAIGDKEAQMNLIPQELQAVHWRKTILGVKAHKDIKKGEMVNFPIEISFPCTNVAKQIIGAKTFSKEVKREQAKEKFTK